MGDGTSNGSGRTNPQARYWRIRTALEVVKFTAWSAALTLHALAANWPFQV